MKAGKRIAVVTGGASGIGKASATLLAERGHSVCVCDLDGDGARSVARTICDRGGEALAWELDVSRSDEVRRVFGQIARSVAPPAVLVTSAGVPGHGELAELEDERWERIVAVNLSGVLYCMREAMRTMLPARFGVIVNISSICGIMGCSSSPAYSAAKAGVIGLSKACARRYTEAGIRINVVAPGLVDTPFVEPDRAMGKLEKGIAKIPLGRMGTAEEIASVVAFLCGDEAAFIAGQVISPNGGQLI